jgi:hypothetical protein
VYLCWQLGEDGIGFWHDLESGFAGRRPLSGPRSWADAKRGARPAPRPLVTWEVCVSVVPPARGGDASLCQSAVAGGRLSVQRGVRRAPKKNRSALLGAPALASEVPPRVGLTATSGVCGVMGSVGRTCFRAHPCVSSLSHRPDAVGTQACGRRSGRLYDPNRFQAGRGGCGRRSTPNVRRTRSRSCS